YWSAEPKPPECACRDEPHNETRVRAILDSTIWRRPGGLPRSNPIRLESLANIKLLLHTTNQLGPEVSVYCRLQMRIPRLYPLKLTERTQSPPPARGGGQLYRFGK